MKQYQIQRNSHDLSDRHIWRMRWIALIALILMFIGTLVVIAVTDNALLVTLPGSMLLAMRPIIRFIFPQGPDKKNQAD